MTIRALCFVVFVLLIGGCTTPAELRQKGPILEQKSLRDAKNVAACIAEGWENAGVYMAQVNMRIAKGGYSVAIRGETSTTLLADIADAPSGESMTSLYSGLFNSAQERKFSEVVIRCQKD